MCNLKQEVPFVALFLRSRNRIIDSCRFWNLQHIEYDEKMDSIAILKATGFSGNDVKWILYPYR
jgi:hypothetical protein